MTIQEFLNWVIEFLKSVIEGDKDKVPFSTTLSVTKAEAQEDLAHLIALTKSVDNGAMHLNELGNDPTVLKYSPIVQN